MSNIWQSYRALTARDRKIEVVTVLAVNADGTSSVQTVGGATVRVLGTLVAVDHKALVRAGQIISAAAGDLPTYQVTV